MVRANVIMEGGSQDYCTGILVEWDLADFNVIERNAILGTDQGILFLGGDNNIVRYNLIMASSKPDPFIGGITILSTVDPTVDFCNSEPQEIIPPADLSHPEYFHYYQPRNCQSFGNKIHHNVIHGYYESVRLYEFAASNTIIQNNVFSKWIRGGICLYDAVHGTCLPLPSDVLTSRNRNFNAFLDSPAFFAPELP